MTNPKISCLLVAYKSNATIREAVESIVAQQGSFEKEIIVVDNFATDSCAELVLRFIPNASVIVNSTNLGFTHAVNQAASVGGGEYLFLLNPDVRLNPDCTASLLATMTADPQAAAVAPQLLNDNGSIQHSVRNFPTFATLVYEHFGLAWLFPNSSVFGHWKNHYFDHDRRFSVNQPMVSALLIRRDVMEKIGEWDERFFVFFSDVDICKRIIDAGYRIIFEPEAKAYHQVGGSTRQEGNWLIFDSHRGFYRYLAKHELRGLKIVLRPLAAAILVASALMRALARWLTGRSF